MTQIFMALLEHPLVFGFLVLCFLGFVGMTYEFVLRLFGRKGMVEDRLEEFNGKLDLGGNDDEPPKETANVPKPDGPDDVLEDGNEIPSDDEEDYVYQDGNLGISSWTTNYRDADEVKNEKEKEGVH